MFKLGLISGHTSTYKISPKPSFELFRALLQPYRVYTENIKKMPTHC